MERNDTSLTHKDLLPVPCISLLPRDVSLLSRHTSLIRVTLDLGDDSPECDAKPPLQDSGLHKRAPMGMFLQSVGSVNHYFRKNYKNKKDIDAARPGPGPAQTWLGPVPARQPGPNPARPAPRLARARAQAHGRHIGPAHRPGPWAWTMGRPIGQVQGPGPMVRPMGAEHGPAHGSNPWVEPMGRPRGRIHGSSLGSTTIWFIL